MKMTVRSPHQLGQVIKRLRVEQGLTQQKLAEMASITQASLSKFERNPQTSRIETAFALITALNLDIQIDSRSPKTLEKSSLNKKRV